MADNLKSFIVDRDDRLKLIHSDIYQRLSLIWKNHGFSKEQVTGKLSYLIRTASELKNDLLSITDWEEYFFSTANQRCEDIKKSMSSINARNALYSGKTLSEMAELSKQFYLVLIKEQIGLSKKATFNFVYCKFIEEPYILYRRQCTLRDKMQREKSSNHFELSDACTCNENAVDILERDADGNLIMAYQIISKRATDSEKHEYNNKHNIFRDIYGIDVKQLF